MEKIFSTADDSDAQTLNMNTNMQKLLRYLEEHRHDINRDTPTARNAVGLTPEEFDAAAESLEDRGLIWMRRIPHRQSMHGGPAVDASPIAEIRVL